jgi:hypothetical protein
VRRAEDIAVLDGLARAYAKRNEEIERRLVLLLLRHMLAMCAQVDIAAVGNAGCLVRHRPELSVCIALNFWAVNPHPTTTETPGTCDVSASPAASGGSSSINTPKERRNAFISFLTLISTIMGFVVGSIFGLMTWFEAGYANAFARKSYEL